MDTWRVLDSVIVMCVCVCVCVLGVMRAHREHFLALCCTGHVLQEPNESSCPASHTVMMSLIFFLHGQ